MKKTIALLLAAILLLSLAACGQTAQPAEPAATCFCRKRCSRVR